MDDFGDTLHPSVGPYLAVSQFGLEDSVMGAAFLEANKVACLLSREQYLALSHNPAFTFDSRERAYVLHGGDIDIYVYENYKGRGTPTMKVDLGRDVPTLLRGNPPNIESIDLTYPHIETPLTQYFLHQYMRWERELRPQETATPVQIETLYKREPFGVVGDLDGRYTNFQKLSQEAGIIDAQGRWIAGSRKAVYLGDILADRGEDGFRILEAIAQLREQARDQGGDISVLMGNHDEFMSGYLTEIYQNLGSLSMTKHFHTEGIGKLTELIQFGDIGYPEQIRENMKYDTIGLSYLQHITEMGIVGRVGDSIFFHTPPNKAMLEAVLGNGGNIDENIRTLNQTWRENLQSLLFQRGNVGDPNDQRVGIYKKLASIFLHTGNTTKQDHIDRGGDGEGESIFYENPDLYSRLYTAGIRSIFTGHTSAVLPENIAGVQLIGVNKKAYRNE